MRIAHVLVCHSVDPSKCLASIPDREGAKWYIFLHGCDPEIENIARSFADTRDARLLPYKRNRGLAKSWNEAIRYGREDGCEAYLLLNDDLFFYEKAYEQFVETVEQKSKDDGCYLISMRGLESGASPHAGQVHTQLFACCALTRTAVERIGAFDEHFWPAYFEDVDYRIRATRLGLTHFVDERVLVEHERSSTSRLLSPAQKRSLGKSFQECRSYIFEKWGNDDQGIYAREFKQIANCEGSTPTTLVVYHYFEGRLSKANLEFFLKVGLVENVDYVFLISGGCSVPLPVQDNVEVLHAENLRSDFSAYADVLRSNRLDLDYDNFVFMNCTIMGPFLANAQNADDWTRIFTDMLKGDVKVSGISINALPPNSGASAIYRGVHGGGNEFLSHVQSMLFAVDREYLEFLLDADFFSEQRFHGKDNVVVSGEIRLSRLAIDNGWNITCILPEYAGLDYRNLNSPVDTTAKEGDPWFPSAYFGANLQPFETIFVKTNRDIVSPAQLEIHCAKQIRRAGPPRRSNLDRALASSPSAWGGHKNFARWLVAEVEAECVVDLGVEFGYSTLCLAAGARGTVYGIDRFPDTSDEAEANLDRAGVLNVRLIKAEFLDAAKSWDRPIDILHIDGEIAYDDLRECYTAWLPHLTPSGVVLLHDTDVGHFGVRRLFDEIDLPKINLRNDHGLGVISRDAKLIEMISSIFSSLI